MAYNQSSSDDGDMLSDGGAGPETQKDQAGGTDGQTALVPTSFCPGMKPGDQITATIEEVQDGQYLLSYDKTEAEPDQGDVNEASEAPEGGAGDTEMQSMME